MIYHGEASLLDLYPPSQKTTGLPVDVRHLLRQMARSRPDDTSGRKCEKVFASADVADGQAFSVSADNSDSSKKICPKFSQRFAVGVHKGTTGLPVGLHCLSIGRYFCFLGWAVSSTGRAADS